MPQSGSFNVVLVEPEIPPNTGNIGRLCLAADATLHLVHPLGFTLSEPNLRRAGLDYWHQVRLIEHTNLDDLFEAIPATQRFFLLSTKGRCAYWGQTFRQGDWFIFGRETRGLPESLLLSHPGQVLTIPMACPARSLNLATAAGIVLFEAVRQLALTTAPPSA